MYSTLGVRPQTGRLPVAEDGDNVVLISDQLWDTWFGRDPAVVGKTYFVSGQMREVIAQYTAEQVYSTARHEIQNKISERTVERLNASLADLEWTVGSMLNAPTTVPVTW